MRQACYFLASFFTVCNYFMSLGSFYRLVNEIVHAGEKIERENLHGYLHLILFGHPDRLVNVQ